MAVKYYIGCSGWHYEHWRGLCYPQGLPRSKWLSFYSQQFDTVELNNSFYRVPSETAFTRWRESRPRNFVFAAKVSRLITHIKRLRNLGTSVEGFLCRAGLLKEKLGPLLYQLPPSLQRNDELLQDFLSSLSPKCRHVIEFRHESWIDERVFAVLRRDNVALCVSDMPGFCCPLVATSDFAYVRFHGSHGLCCSSYSEEELTQWAEGIAGLGKEVEASCIYFNNDAEAFAVKNAITLRNLLQSLGSRPRNSECQNPNDK